MAKGIEDREYPEGLSPEELTAIYQEEVRRASARRAFLETCRIGSVRDLRERRGSSPAVLDGFVAYVSAEPLGDGSPKVEASHEIHGGLGKVPLPSYRNGFFRW